MKESRVTGPLFKWFGSKWLSSKTLPAPKHSLVIEPFAGSAGYSLRYAAGKRAVLAETDPHLYALWKWLIWDASEALIREIPVNVKPGTDIRTLGLDPGQALLMKTWQRTNNVGDCWTVSPWGNLPGQWTVNTRARVASEVGAARLWSISNSASLVLSMEWPSDTTWFIDPPYEYNYRYKSREQDEPEWYSALGASVRGLAGQRIVCEAVCPKTGRVPGWLPFTPWASRITSRRKAGNHTHSKELLCVLDT